MVRERAVLLRVKARPVLMRESCALVAGPQFPANDEKLYALFAFLARAKLSTSAKLIRKLRNFQNAGKLIVRVTAKWRLQDPFETFELHHGTTGLGQTFAFEPAAGRGRWRHLQTFTEQPGRSELRHICGPPPTLLGRSSA